jgi:shikimate dehydrogenase
LLSDAARIAGVMGWPVGHSLSPLLHGHWLRRYGIDGSYIPLPVRPEDVALAFRALPRLGFRGWNVTIPHKEAAFALVERRDAAAERTGTVNTVLVQPDGSLLGSSTDGYGFIANLDAVAPSWRAGKGPAVVLGAGGAAKAVAVALSDAGVGEMRLMNRGKERARALTRHLEALAPVRIEVVDWQDRDLALTDAALLVNTTSLGMKGQEPLALSLEILPAKAIVADIVYVPLLTDLLRAAQARGNPTVDGLGMLLHQAVPGFSWWGGVTPTVDTALRSCLLEALALR